MKFNSEAVSIADLFGINAPKEAMVQVFEPSLDTPAIDESYVFTEDQIKKLTIWFIGNGKKSIFVDGPTGCGKTTLFEQYCARRGIDLFIIPCHGKLDMVELIGSKSIAENGSTFFEKGALIKALQHPRPAVVLLDEMNFIPASAAGLLNRIAEMKPFTIGETGELIRPNPWVRLAASGNGVARGDDAPHYRGTQTMNLALLNRFYGMKMGYLDPLKESAMLHTAMPTLHGKLKEKLVEIASVVRAAFEQSTIGTVMSTRSVLDIAQVLLDRGERVYENPLEELQWAVEFCLTNLALPEDREHVRNVIRDKCMGMKLTRTGSRNVPKPTAQSSSGDMQTNAEIELYIHPTRDENGPAYWGVVEIGTSKGTFNGNLDKSETRDCDMTRDSTYVTSKISEKTGKGYLLAGRAKVFIQGGISAAQENIFEVINAMMSRIRDAHQGTSVQVPTNEVDLHSQALHILSS
jgi:cobaltochelatase CobS